MLRVMTKKITVQHKDRSFWNCIIAFYELHDFIQSNAKKAIFKHVSQIQ